MEHEELQKALEEDATSKAILTTVCATELVGIVFAILVREGVASPQRIREVLAHFVAGAQSDEGDSPEKEFGMELLVKSIALLHRRVDEIEAGKTLASTDQTFRQ